MHNHNVNGKRYPHTSCPRSRTLTRRSFLRTSALAAAGALLAGCGQTPEPTATMVPPEPTATIAPEVVIPKVSSDAAKAKVAIAQAKNYDPDTVYARVRDMLDGLGGIADIVRPGDHVAIKTNLTGGTNWEGKTWGLPATETFVTHPEVVKALGKLVLDAGAGKLYIVEAVYQWESYSIWGYEDVAKELGATLIDSECDGAIHRFRRDAGAGWRRTLQRIYVQSHPGGTGYLYVRLQDEVPLGGGRHTHDEESLRAGAVPLLRA